MVETKTAAALEHKQKEEAKHSSREIKHLRKLLGRPPSRPVVPLSLQMGNRFQAIQAGPQELPNGMIQPGTLNDDYTQSAANDQGPQFKGGKKSKARERSYGGSGCDLDDTNKKRAAKFNSAIHLGRLA